MLLEQGVEVDHSTIYRWAGILCSKDILDKLKWYWKPRSGFILKDKIAYLYRALDKNGNTIDVEYIYNN